MAGSPAEGLEILVNHAEFQVKIQTMSMKRCIEAWENTIRPKVKGYEYVRNVRLQAFITGKKVLDKQN